MDKESGFTVSDSKVSLIKRRHSLIRSIASGGVQTTSKSQAQLSFSTKEIVVLSIAFGIVTVQLSATAYMYSKAINVEDCKNIFRSYNLFVRLLNVYF